MLQCESQVGCNTSKRKEGAADAAPSSFPSFEASLREAPQDDTPISVVNRGT